VLLFGAQVPLMHAFPVVRKKTVECMLGRNGSRDWGTDERCGGEMDDEVMVML
jgi:hypothetical protein